MRPQGIDIGGGGGSRNNFLTSSIDPRRDSPPTIQRDMKRSSRKSRVQRHHVVVEDDDEDEIRPSLRKIKEDPTLFLPMPKNKKNKIIRCCRSADWTHVMTWINFGLIVVLAVFVGIYSSETTTTHTEKSVLPETDGGTPFIITSDSIDTIVKLPFPLEGGIRRFEVCCKKKNIILCTSHSLGKKLEIRTHLSIKDNSAHISVSHPDMVGIPCNLYLF